MRDRGGSCQASFISRLPVTGAGWRLGVKDVIDVAGAVTTGGCPVVARGKAPAVADAPCVTRARLAGAEVVGKTNLVELALGAHGMNRWYGTPVNPLGRGLIPGGSSSGSAVAVATGEVDLAFGTDTGGSIRIPAACCGIVGMKPSHGLVSTEGVMPLAPSLDCVGPMAASVDRIATAMGWLAATRPPKASPHPCVILHSGAAEPAVVEAVRRALAGAEIGSEAWDGGGWAEAWRAGGVLLDAEAAQTFAALRPRWERLDERVRRRLSGGASYTSETVSSAKAQCSRWTHTLQDVLAGGRILVTPTLPVLPPSYRSWRSVRLNWFTLPVNVAGLPAIALPVPRGGGLPASMQLVGPVGGEAVLLAVARQVETAIASW